MRQLSLFVGFSIKLTHEPYGMSLGEAKEAVHFSQTWADCRDANDEAAFEALKQLGFTEAELGEHSEAAEILQQTR